MTNLRNRFPARRRFLKQSAALTASASMAAPVIALAAARDPAPAELQTPAEDRCASGVSGGHRAPRDRGSR